MAQPHPAFAPPSEPVWDVTFTRLANALRPRMEACMQELARRFRAMDLRGELQYRQTPRGPSAFLSVVGRRGLLCIVDITLVDGMAVGQGARARFDVRLLDACGDVVAEDLAHCLQGWPALNNTPALGIPPEAWPQAATAVYVSALGHFDLRR